MGKDRGIRAPHLCIGKHRLDFFPDLSPDSPFLKIRINKNISEEIPVRLFIDP